MNYILGILILLIFTLIAYTYGGKGTDILTSEKDIVTKPLKSTIQNTKEIIREEIIPSQTSYTEKSQQIKITRSAYKNKLKTDLWPPEANDGLEYYQNEEISEDISDKDMDENEKILLKSFLENKNKYNYKVYEYEDEKPSE